MATFNTTVGLVTDRGLHPKRSANEDRLLVLPESHLYLVADGVGGRRGGQVASQTAVDVFTRIFSQPDQQDKLALLKQAIVAGNQRIYDDSMQVPGLSGMATTLAVAVVDDGRVIIGHVGDSRVYRFDGQRLTCETEDHSEVAEAMRTGELTAVQAARHPNRNIITRALGIEPEVTADFTMVALTERTSLLLCSDGITRHIPDKELEEVMKSGAHPQSICNQLKELCYARGAEDNLTAIVVDFGARVYQEEQTRPRSTVDAVAKTMKAAAASAQTPDAASRISVDFNAEQEAPPGKHQGFRKRTSASVATKRTGASLVSNLLQLALLLLLLAGAFLVGRYYEQLYALIWGKPLPTATAAQSDTPDAPQALVPASPDFAAARGLFAEKRYEQARDQLLPLVNSEPANAEYRFFLGRAQYELKQYQEAVKNLSEAAKLNPQLPGVFLHLALAYDALGNRSAVSENLRRAAEH